MKVIKIMQYQLLEKIKNVKEIANYIVIGKESVIDYLKDARISLEFRAKLVD